MNVKECESNINNTLKKLANIKTNRKPNPLILKDMLGADADYLVGSLIRNNRKSKTR